MAERKRLGREHTCRCSSAHKMWAREEGKQNRKVGAEENSNGQKLLLLLKSVAELLRGLLEAKFSQRKRCRLLPVCIWKKQPSVQAWHVHPCWGLRAGVSWDLRGGDSDAAEAVLGQAQC